MDSPGRHNSAAQENELISRFLGGEHAAFAGLVELYKNSIHQFIICILGPDRDAEDIAQEVFIQIYNSLSSFRRDSSFSTWAYALARNVCRRHLRSRGREPILLNESTDDKTINEIPDGAPPHETIIENAETQKIVQEAINGLSPIHRTVLFLSCWERLSYAEISLALDVPVGTVRSRLHNAMAALAQKLRPVLNIPEQGG